MGVIEVKRKEGRRVAINMKDGWIRSNSHTYAIKLGDNLLPSLIIHVS